MIAPQGGHFRLHRKLFSNRAFRNDGEALAFAWLVYKAAWQPMSVSYKRHTLTLERGQAIVSVRDMVEQMERSIRWVHGLLNRLEEHDMITRGRPSSGTLGGTQNGTLGGTLAGTLPTIITICNYDTYQASVGRNGTLDGTLSGTQNGTPLKKERMNEREKTPPIIPPKPDPPDLPDWLPVEAWEGWLEMRKAKRAPATARARSMAITKLDQMRKRGFDPAKVLDLATMRCWTDIYEPKGDEGRVQARLSI